ncbi:hypothetical protein T4D_6522 [Trichinella pseudospiralis]|uniref:Uncharacterized protein n=1 Tax=Trichinella pseudospiralis TaxID=6337 RepID=A0A0V1FNU8_TRIPS|nr:hypothetical protein T4D_6522 [Trichinella pseudospiralis]
MVRRPEPMGLYVLVEFISGSLKIHENTCMGRMQSISKQIKMNSNFHMFGISENDDEKFLLG